MLVYRFHIENDTDAILHVPRGDSGELTAGIRDHFHISIDARRVNCNVIGKVDPERIVKIHAIDSKRHWWEYSYYSHKNENFRHGQAFSAKFSLLILFCLILI
jgi:hypothetical protein